MDNDETEPSPDSFEEIVNAYYQPLYRFGVSLSKSESAASDLTQETFRTYAVKGSDIRDRSKIKSWLFTTLYREFLKLRRKSERVDHYEPEVLEATVGASPSEARRKHDANLALEALEAVDEKFREPLALFYIEDLSYKEIASILDLPIGTVMSRLNRGKAQLRAAFEVNGAALKPTK